MINRGWPIIGATPTTPKAQPSVRWLPGWRAASHPSISTSASGLRQHRFLAQRRYRHAGLALCNDIAGATFTAAALRGHAQLQLDLIETHSGAGMAGDFSVRNTAADTDDHGGQAGHCWQLERYAYYKCEFVAFNIFLQTML